MVIALLSVTLIAGITIVVSGVIYLADTADDKAAVRPADPAVVAMYHAENVQALRQYPEYYRCTSRPAADEQLTQQDFVPNTNVVAHLRYEPKENQYLVVGGAGDPRITIDSSVVDLDDPDPNKRRVQTMVIGFEDGVRYFRTYEYYALDANSSQFVWVASRPLYNNIRDAPFLLVAYPNYHKYLPEYLIVAAATNTCNPGTAALPASFVWSDVIAQGQAVPEYAAYHMGHPQG